MNRRLVQIGRSSQERSDVACGGSLEHGAFCGGSDESEQPDNSNVIPFPNRKPTWLNTPPMPQWVKDWLDSVDKEGEE